MKLHEKSLNVLRNWYRAYFVKERMLKTKAMTPDFQIKQSLKFCVLGVRDVCAAFLAFVAVDFFAAALAAALDDAGSAGWTNQFSYRHRHSPPAGTSHW